MKHVFGIFLALFVVGGAYAVPARVSDIISGDKILMVASLDGGDEAFVQIRLVNADAPELRDKCDSAKRTAKSAKERLASLMPIDSVVELKNVKKDMFTSRFFANVILPDGRDVGEILIKEKLGRAFDGVHRYSWCK